MKTNEPNLRKGQKKLILGKILVSFGPNLVLKKIFCGFYLSWMLGIVTSYHIM